MTQQGRSWAFMDEAARKEYWASLALRHCRGLGARSAARLARFFGSAYAAVQARQQWGEAGVNKGQAAELATDSWRVTAREEWDRARDLSAAVCTSNFPFVVETDKIFMITGHRRNDDGTSDLAEVQYFLKNDPVNAGRKILVRRLRNTMDGINRSIYLPGGSRDTLAKITGLPFWSGTADAYSGELAGNVYSFRIVCYDANNNVLPSYNSIDTSRGDSNFKPALFPARIEMTLEILPDDTWKRIDAGSSTASLIDSTLERFSIAISPSQTAY